MTVPNLYKNLYNKPIFTFKDVRALIKNNQMAKNAVSQLTKKGYFKHIKKGLYCVVPFGLIGKKYFPDEILLASHLVEPYFFSHHTALRLHGVANSIFSVIFISSSKISSPLNYGDYVYTFVKTRHHFGVQDKLYAHQKIKVTDPERTLLDCIRQMKYAGGIEEVLKSITSFPSLDYKKIALYLAKFNEKKQYQKTGFILEFLKEELGVSSRFLANLQKQVGKRTYYLDAAKKGTCRRVKKWKLMVPKNIKGVAEFV